MNQGWIKQVAAVAAASLALVGLCRAEAVPGQPAPALALVDANGRAVSLADFRSKYVVIEWTNPHCPFVRKHYDSGNMQRLQKSLAAPDLIWLTVNSTAASHPEYMNPQALAGWIRQNEAAPTAVLLDADGKVGRGYGARTTPHMYVIDPRGRVAYAGGIDDKRSTQIADVKTARNFVAQAMEELRAGKPVSTASALPYGCSIKYQ